MRDRSMEVANGRFKNSSGNLEIYLQSATFDHCDSSTWLSVQQIIPIIYWLKINNIYFVYDFIWINVSLNPKTFNHIMIVRCKKPANQLAQPQVNFKFCWPPPWQCCLWFFSLYTAMWWDACGPQKFLFIWKLGQGLLKTGLLWTHCPQTAYFMVGLHSGDSGHHLLTPGPPLCYHQPPFHFIQPPPVAGLAGLQGTCSFALFLSLFSLSVCVCVCAHVCMDGADMGSIHLFVSVLTHLYSLLLAASKSTKRKQLSAAVAAKVNNTINPPFTSLRLQGLDHGITSGQTGRSCETANHDGGDFRFLRSLAWEQFLCLARRSATHSFKILPSLFLFQTRPEKNKSSGGTLAGIVHAVPPPQLCCFFRAPFFSKRRFYIYTFTAVFEEPWNQPFVL